MAPRKTAAERAAEAAAAAEETQVVQTVDDESAPPEVPLEDLAAKADAEGLQLEDATGDGADGNDDPTPDPDAVEPEQETGDADVLQYDPNRLGAPEQYVHKRWPHAARGRIVRQLFDAADVLGYPADVIRSTSDGFKYPESIDRYLFPSEYRA